jgi:hypothetical protein
VALQIPNEEIPSIVKIVELPESITENLIQALSSSTVTSVPDEMATRIAERVAGIPIEDLTKIVDLIYSLYQIRQFADVSESQFLDDFMEGVRDAKDSGLILEHLDAVKVKDRFSRLLSIRTLSTLSKAIALQRDGERLYCEAKILSDIRPVFADDAALRPIAAVVNHTMKLTYHEAKEHKEFFVVLDKGDIQKLLDALNRALAKDETLRTLLSESEIPELGV